jgi:hypothetical protein
MWFYILDCILPLCLIEKMEDPAGDINACTHGDEEFYILPPIKKGG